LNKENTVAKKKRGTGWKAVCKMVQDENMRLRDELAEAQSEIRRLKVELHLLAPMLQRSEQIYFTSISASPAMYTNPPATVDHVTPKKKV
jgi:hypothetical protein